MNAHECFARREDAYIVIVLSRELDVEWGSPSAVSWANPALDPQSSDPVLLQASSTPDALPVRRSKQETLIALAPHHPLYRLIQTRGMPVIYNGAIDDQQRLALSRKTGLARTAAT